MFFSITMALFITKLVAMVSVINERLLRLNSYRYIVVNVLISEIGIETAGIIVARFERRNKNIIRIISVIEIISVCSIFFSEARMVGERFWVICRLIVVGMVFCNFGNFVRMLLIVWIILVFGSLRIISKIVGLALVISALRIFCIESVIVVISFRRIASSLL